MKKFLAIMLFAGIATVSVLEARSFTAKRSIQRGLCRSGICRKAGKFNRRVATRAARPVQRNFSAPVAAAQPACPNGMCFRR